MPTALTTISVLIRGGEPRPWGPVCSHHRCPGGCRGLVAWGEDGIGMNRAETGTGSGAKTAACTPAALQITNQQ